MILTSVSSDDVLTLFPVRRLYPAVSFTPARLYAHAPTPVAIAAVCTHPRLVKARIAGVNWGYVCTSPSLYTIIRRRHSFIMGSGPSRSSIAGLIPPRRREGPWGCPSGDGSGRCLARMEQDGNKEIGNAVRMRYLSRRHRWKVRIHRVAGEMSKQTNTYVHAFISLGTRC